MKYPVHIYAVCRRDISVEADSQEEAVTKANEMDMTALFNHNPDVEYADEVQDFLVDQPGDTNYKESHVYKIGEDGKPVKELFPCLN